jgi:hypothetical protein
MKLKVQGTEVKHISVIYEALMQMLLSPVHLWMLRSLGDSANISSSLLLAVTESRYRFSSLLERSISRR